MTRLHFIEPRGQNNNNTPKHNFAPCSRPEVNYDALTLSSPGGPRADLLPTLAHRVFAWENYCDLFYLISQQVVEGKFGAPPPASRAFPPTLLPCPR